MKAFSSASLVLATVFLLCLASFSFAAGSTPSATPQAPQYTMSDGFRGFPTSSSDTSTHGNYVSVEASCGKVLVLANGDKTKILYYITGNAYGNAKPDMIFYQDLTTSYYKYTLSRNFAYTCLNTNILMSMARGDRSFPTSAIDTTTYGYYVLLHSACTNSFITPKNALTDSIYYIYDKPRGAAKIGSEFYQRNNGGHFAYFDTHSFGVSCTPGLVPAEPSSVDQNTVYGVIAAGVLIGAVIFFILRKRSW